MDCSSRSFAVVQWQNWCDAFGACSCLGHVKTEPKKGLVPLIRWMGQPVLSLLEEKSCPQSLSRAHVGEHTWRICLQLKGLKIHGCPVVVFSLVQNMWVRSISWDQNRRPMETQRSIRSWTSEASFARTTVRTQVVRKL